jgi:hypothetical protein
VLDARWPPSTLFFQTPSSLSQTVWTSPFRHERPPVPLTGLAIRLVGRDVALDGLASKVLLGGRPGLRSQSCANRSTPARNHSDPTLSRTRAPGNPGARAPAGAAAAGRRRGSPRPPVRRPAPEGWGRSSSASRSAHSRAGASITSPVSRPASCAAARNAPATSSTAACRSNAST